MPQEAIMCYQRAIHARPDYAMAYGETNFGIQCTSFMLSFHCCSEMYAMLSLGNLASIYYDQGQLDLAIVHYKQAIACDSKFLEAYNNLVSSSLWILRVCIVCMFNCATIF